MDVKVDWKRGIFIQYVEYDDIKTPIMLKIPIGYTSLESCVGEYKQVVKQMLNDNYVYVFMVASKDGKYADTIKKSTLRVIGELHERYKHLPVYVIDLDGNVNKYRV